MRELGIKIIGDVAIFVSYDSAAVWTHPDLFHLDEQLEPYVVAGVPPDAFSATGQRWGNPLYRWDVLRSRGYDWWIERMRAALATCDIVRLDHFLGFHHYWEIAATEPTAVRGRWVEGPRDDLFHALRQALGKLPLIAEDLGLITDEVRALRQRLGLPGMRVLQFGFGNRGAHIYLPHQFEHDTVVYTGTHDNDTTLGWWQHRQRAGAVSCLGLSGPRSRGDELGLHPRGAGFHRRAVRGAAAGRAGAGQRSAHECPQPSGRQLDMALPAWCADRRAGVAPGYPRGSFGPRPAALSRTPAGRREMGEEFAA